MRNFTRAAVAALLAGGLLAGSAVAEKDTSEWGVLKVNGNDESKTFTAEGVTRAESVVGGVRFDHGLTVTVDTFRDVPADKKAAAEAAKTDREKWHRFMEGWTHERAKAARTNGIHIVIVEHPVGGVGVIADKETRVRGFSDRDEEQVREKLIRTSRRRRPSPTRRSAPRSATPGCGTPSSSSSPT